MIALPHLTSLLECFAPQLPAALPPSASGKQSPLAAGDPQGKLERSPFSLLMGLFQEPGPGGRQPATKPVTTDDAVSPSLASALNPASLPSNPAASADRLRAALSTQGASITTNLSSSAFPTPQTVPPASAIYTVPTPSQVGVDVAKRLGRDGRVPGGDQPAVKPINASIGQQAQTLTAIPDLPRQELAPPQTGLARLPRGTRSHSGKAPASSFISHPPSEPQTPTQIISGLPGKSVETDPSNAVPKTQPDTEAEFAPVMGEDRPRAATSSQALGLAPQLHTELAPVTNEDRPRAATSSQALGLAPQLHTEFAPVTDEDRLPTATSSQALGLAPLVQGTNVSPAHSKRNQSPVPPPPFEDLDISSPTLSTVSTPVQAQSAVAGPSATVTTDPQARTAEPAAAAQPQPMSSTRALGNALGERAAQLDDFRVSSEAPGSPHNSQGDAYEQAAVRAGSENQAQSTELAFGGRLVPVVPTEGPTRADRTDLQTSLADKAYRFAGLSSLPGSPDPVGEKAVMAVQATGLNVGYRKDGATNAGEEENAAPAERERKLTAAGSADGEPASAAARTALVPPRLSPESVSGGAVRPKGDPPPPEAASARIESEAPKTPAATRDIKLEVGSGDQRVELHLTERAGDVHVEVRTPDTHLAGELRENLPDLSSRLEHTGLRPEEWHTTTPVSSDLHRQEHSAGTSSNDANGQPRQDTREQQGDPESRQPKVFEEQPNRKEKGKDFQWFMSSLH